MLRWADLPRKNPTQLKKQIEQGLTCTVEGCDQPLTQKTGPGQDLLCREHQKNLREFGGTGRLDRPWTHHRKWVCDKCGKDVQEDLRKKYPKIYKDDPVLFARLSRSRIVGDHIVRKVDGGLDTEENIQTLCLDCNSDKTILSEDYYRKENGLK